MLMPGYCDACVDSRKNGVQWFVGIQSFWWCCIM
jgi:hypothetical protein